MVKRAALIVGIIFIIIGVAGFIPGLTVDSEGMKKLFGLFMVDTPHNIIHLLTGAAFLATHVNEKRAPLVFQVFGVVYALVTLIGFIVGSGGSVLGLFQVNTADNFLHLAITAAFVYFGFAVPERKVATTEV